MQGSCVVCWVPDLPPVWCVAWMLFQRQCPRAPKRVLAAGHARAPASVQRMARGSLATMADRTGNPLDINAYTRAPDGPLGGGPVSEDHGGAGPEAGSRTPSQTSSVLGGARGVAHHKTRHGSSPTRPVRRWKRRLRGPRLCPRWWRGRRMPGGQRSGLGGHPRRSQ